MENIPKELEETQLNLQVVIDPETKCLTMKTTNTEDPIDGIKKEETPTTDILTNDDPLLEKLPEPPKLEEMSDLDRLIYEERARLLNIKIHKPPPKTTRKPRVFSNQWSGKRAAIRTRLRRERETSEEREFNRFRQRIITSKARLLKKLQNFEDETPLKEMTKVHTERMRKIRLQRKLSETPEQRAQRKSIDNTKTRLAHLRKKVFKTAEDILEDKERNKRYKENYLSRFTLEERRAIEKENREKAKERQRKVRREWKKVDMIIKGAKPMDDTDDDNDDIEEFVKEAEVKEDIQLDCEKDVGAIVVEDLMLGNIPVKSEVMEFI